MVTRDQKRASQIHLELELPTVRVTVWNWELNLGPMEEQSVCFATGPSLQPLFALQFTFFGTLQGCSHRSPLEWSCCVEDLIAGILISWIQLRVPFPEKGATHRGRISLLRINVTDIISYRHADRPTQHTQTSTETHSPGDSGVYQVGKEN